MLQAFTDEAESGSAGLRHPALTSLCVICRPNQSRPERSSRSSSRSSRSPPAEDLDPVSIPPLPWENPGVWFYIVEEGQSVLVRNPNGSMDVIVGPRRVWRGRASSSA